jgi:U3 small nucleolar RNA-associated protein 16
MFSRIYQSARALFTDTPQNEKIQPAQVVEPLRHETMVTTRKRLSQEAVGEEIDDENSINVYVPSSSKSRQKRTKQEDVVVLSDDDDATSTPTSTRKRKRLPVRAKDVESPGLSKTRPVVEIPTKKISPEPDHGKDLTIENEEVVSEDQDEERESKAVESLKNSKHHRFESEQVDDEFFSTAREAAVEENATSKTPADAPTIEDSEDSEDDAPEAVGIQEAAMSVKLKDRDAAKAVKEYV